MTKYHLIYIMFVISKNNYKNHQFKDQRIPAVLDILLKVFALKQLQEDPQALYECGYFGAGAGKLLDETLKDVLLQLRPQMISLTERFEQDFLLSSIGNQFGDIYEA